ncbi:MAG: TIR domain-containing protein [Gracilibacteraceae bacterium]|jgi:hypothetical protein|nr:TIR domain-containing protein [Gracilibacteraceae bacterium]
MRYDAFISYRHGELDGLVAEKLHRMLETYRIPAPIAQKTGKKKLERVFRDREELPTSSNLSDSINEALENSDFLLLICSRRTCGSQWVMREVERFGELHGKDKIITLLIDGEPDESFPPGLREREVGGEKIFVEPLAADIRAATWAGSIKLLKEEKLRLLAPVLGCAFDDLRRRHRARRIRRIAALVSAAFVFTLSFGSFSTYQYVRIDREMQLKLENQSYVLAEYSEREMADGDPDAAARLALEALPLDLERPERPFVPAAEKALADALGVYDAASGFKPYKAVRLPAAPGKILLSPGERYAAFLRPFELMVYDLERGQEALQLPTVRSALADVWFLSDSVVLFTGPDALTAYDIEKGATLWQGAPATKIAVSADGSLIAAVYKDSGAAALYSPEGRALGEISFRGRAMRIPADDSFIDPRDTLFALSASGGRLAVSFADGSLAVFDTATGAETPVYPRRLPGFMPEAVSPAVHCSGGFYRETLAFAAVTTEPYYAVFLIYDAETGEEAARYESDSARFIPLAGEGGLYVAFADQIMTVDARTGEAAHAVSAGGRVETFQKNGETFLICESEGPYRFAGADSRTYQSGYTCHFAAIGEKYALTGSYDAKTVRILRYSGDAGEALLTYDRAYRFSEAKLSADRERAVFYSYNGLRLCDWSGTVLAEQDFPDPLAVLDTQYDEASGNVAVLYQDRLLIYSGADGSLLLEVKGKTGVKSVFYTDFGVSVLGADGVVTLYDLTTATAAATAAAEPDAATALPVGGGLVTVRDERVFWNGSEIGAGELIGASRADGDAAVFAIADGAAGAVFTARGGAAEKSFDFEAIGRAEAYFAGGYVFISPLHGDAAAYAADGTPVRALAENAYLAEIRALDGYIAAGYVSAASERYTFLLDPVTLETTARLPGFLGTLDAGTLVLDTDGSLRTVRLLNTRELAEMARARLEDEGI